MSSVKPPVTIMRWREHVFDHPVRIAFEVTAQPKHVTVTLTDPGYSEASRLGLSYDGDPDDMKKLAEFFRQFASTLEAACEVAKKP